MDPCLRIRFSHGGPEYDAKYPDGIPTAIDITLKSGKEPASVENPVERMSIATGYMWVDHKVLWDLVSMDNIDQRWSKWPQCHNRIVNYVCREMYGDTCEVISSGMASLMHSLGPVVLRSGSCFKTPATSSRHSRWMSVKKSPDRLQCAIETKGSWDCWQVEALL